MKQLHVESHLCCDAIPNFSTVVTSMMSYIAFNIIFFYAMVHRPATQWAYPPTSIHISWAGVSLPVQEKPSPVNPRSQVQV